MLRPAYLLLIGISVAALIGLCFMTAILFQWQVTANDADARKLAWQRQVTQLGGRLRDLLLESDKRLLAATQYCGSLAHRTPPLRYESFVAYLRAIHESDSASQAANFTVSIVWAPAVRAADRAQFEAHVRALNGAAFANFTVRTAATDGAELLFPLLYPASAASGDAPSAAQQAVLGIDQRSDAARRAALDFAVATGKASVSSVVASLTDQRRSMLIFEPVFDVVDDSSNGSAKRQLLGVGYSFFQLQSIVNSTLRGFADTVTQLQWLEIDAASNATLPLFLLDSERPRISDAMIESDELAASYSFAFAQRAWRIDVYRESGEADEVGAPLAVYIVLPFAALVLIGAAAMLLRYRVRLDKEQRGQQLLRMVVPEHVAARLVGHIYKVDGGVALRQALVADFYSDVTLCFIDICNFTALSLRLAPKSLVRFLDELVSTIDLIVADYRSVLKIKTIGDAYFVASGVYGSDKYSQRRMLLDAHPHDVSAAAAAASAASQEMSAPPSPPSPPSSSSSSSPVAANGDVRWRSRRRSMLLERFTNHSRHASRDANADANSAGQRGGGGNARVFDWRSLLDDERSVPLPLANLVAALQFCCAVRETIQSRKFYVEMLPEAPQPQRESPRSDADSDGALIESSELSIEVRIGVHIGDVVAGVVGTRRPQYDVWGDACNVAARMESSAKNGTMQISRAVYHTLEQHNLHEDLFVLRQRRRPLTLKGVGTVHVHTVEPGPAMKESLRAAALYYNTVARAEKED